MCRARSSILIVLCILLAGTLVGCQNTADVPLQTSPQSVTSSSSYPEPSSSVKETEVLELPTYIADYNSDTELLSELNTLNLTLRRTDLGISMEEAAPAGKDIWVECIESLLLRPAKSGEGMETPRGIAFEVEFEDPATGRRDVFSFADGEPVRYAGGQWMPESEGRMWKLEDCYEWEPFLAADPFPLGELLDFNPEEVSEFRATGTSMGGYVDETAVMYGDEARQAARELCGMLVYDAKKFGGVGMRGGGVTYNYEIIGDTICQVQVGAFAVVDAADPQHYVSISGMVSIPESAYPELKLPDKGIDPDMIIDGKRSDGNGTLLLSMRGWPQAIVLEDPVDLLAHTVCVADFEKLMAAPDNLESYTDTPSPIRFQGYMGASELTIYANDIAKFETPIFRNTTYYALPTGTYERTREAVENVWRESE